MIKEGKYIYSIIQDSNPPPTLPSASPIGPYENRSFGPIGINNREVKIVPYKDIAVVVSNTPVINFDRLDKKELTKHVATHQKVNEEIMKDYDIVPMTFGIITPSSDEVPWILEKAYLQFKTALKNIAGKAEFAVQVWWDPKKLLEELANANPEIRKLKQKVALKGSPEGKPSVSYGVNILGMPMKLKLGKLIQKEAEIQRQTFINDIQQILGSISHGFTSNKLIDDACPVGSRRLSFGEMIANFSFLIEKAKESELDKKMQELGKKYEGKLRFKYIGPMPPYSFVKINLSLGNFEVVDDARKLLGLPEVATLDEIKKAYYTLAHQYHPDKFQGKEEQMKKITQAYAIIENYCQSFDDFEGKTENQKYSFREEDVKAAILIH